MEEKFQLLKVRAFTDVINDSIAFAKRYIKQFGYPILVLVVPIYILGSFLYSGIMASTYGHSLSANYFDLKRYTMAGSLGLLTLTAGRILLSIIFISTFLYVENSENGEIDSKDILGSITGYLGRLLGFYFLTFLIVGIIAGLCAMIGMALASVSAIGIMVLLGILAGTGLIYIIVPFSFVPFIYVREDCSFGDAFTRAFFLIRNNWWWTFLMLMVGGLIGAMGAYIFSVPLFVLSMMKTFSSLRGGHTGYDVSIVDRVAMTLSQFSGIITTSVVTIVCYMQYYSLVEKKDGVSLMEQIDSIGKDNNPTN